MDCVNILKINGFERIGEAKFRTFQEVDFKTLPQSFVYLRLLSALA